MIKAIAVFPFQAERHFFYKKEMCIFERDVHMDYRLNLLRHLLFPHVTYFKIGITKMTSAFTNY